ncbi:MAG: helix-turn-helix domain-containing protein [Treponemataceae bacterium]|nr:helix-turn-helix domain-containing protein [Treponemataceae bacterium]
MIHAYDKNYLAKAQNNLAVMFDFAVYDLDFSLEDFYTLFLLSEISHRFEEGDISVIAGKSGVETVLEIIGDDSKADRYRPSADRSPEYWTGWALAYFQWETNLQFNQIHTVIPISEIRSMYNPYHEMDISQFCDHMKSLYTERNAVSNIKKLRMAAGLSQSELSRISEVPLKTVQQYEQKQKNINAAKAETILKLAKSLSCSVEQLMELD